MPTTTIEQHRRHQTGITSNPVSTTRRHQNLDLVEILPRSTHYKRSIDGTNSNTKTGTVE
jgi:hypothetical protein